MSGHGHDFGSESGSRRQSETENGSKSGKSGSRKNMTNGSPQMVSEMRQQAVQAQRAGACS